MPGQYWSALLNAPNPGIGGPNASFTTARQIGPLPALVLPANYLQTGSVLRVTAFGVFSVTGTPTFNVSLQYNAVVLAISGTITATSGVTNVPWRFETTSTVRTLNATTTPVITQGSLQYGTAVTAVTLVPVPPTALATVNIDTTAAGTVDVFWTWSASSSSNTVTTHQLLIESVA